MRTGLIFLFLALVASAAHGGVLDNCYPRLGAECISLDSGPLIGSTEEFLTRRESLASTPHGGAALLMHALIRRNQDRVEGSRMLVLALHPDNLVSSSAETSYEGYGPSRSTEYLIGQIDKMPPCMDTYAPPGDSLVFRFRNQTRHVGSVESGRYIVFLCTPAASICRSVSMRRSPRGLWKVYGLSTIATGCALPDAAGDKRDL